MLLKNALTDEQRNALIEALEPHQTDRVLGFIYRSLTRTAQRTLATTDWSMHDLIELCKAQEIPKYHRAKNRGKMALIRHINHVTIKRAVAARQHNKESK